MNSYYNIYDTTGNVVRGYFKTWKDAYTFLCVIGRYDWSIKKVKLIYIFKHKIFGNFKNLLYLCIVKRNKKHNINN